MWEESEQSVAANEFFRNFKAIAENDACNVAMHLVEDGVPLLSLNSELPFRLASMQKIVVALAYAKALQVHHELAEEKVSVRQLDNLSRRQSHGDGGAHGEWLKRMKLSLEDTVTVQDVAQGMMRDSSNVNTQYMINLLGHKTINAMMKEYRLDIPEFEETLGNSILERTGKAGEIAMLLERVATEEPEIFACMAQCCGLKRSVIKGGDIQFPDSDGGCTSYACSTKFDEKPRLTLVHMCDDIPFTEQEYLRDRALSFMSELIDNPRFKDECIRALAPYDVVRSFQETRSAGGSLHR